MRFAAPHYFHLFWLLIPVAGFLVWSLRRREKALTQLAHAPLLPGLLESVNLKATKWRVSLFLLGLAFLFLALTRPQWGFRWEELTQKGNDVFIALDVSKSMLAEDVKPNRLERAKREVKDLLELLKGDRVGLIAFAGTAFVLSPLTLDAAAVRLFLDDVSPDLLPQGGTAIAEAIRKATASFPGEEKKHKVLILLTDGEDLEGGAIEASQKAKSAGVKIFAVGVGTSAGAPIPFIDETGSRSFVKDKQGQTVLTKLNLQTLSQLSSARVATSLSEVYENEIVPMEKKEFESIRQKKYEEKFQWFLILAFLLFLGEWLVPERKKNGPLRFLGKKKSLPISALCLLFLLPSHGTGAPAYSLIKKGNKKFSEKKWDEAASRYSEAQIKKPESAEIYFNLGDTLYKQGKFKEARQLHEKALDLDDGELKPKIFYNMGNSDFRLGQFEKALQNYESALKLIPEDEDAKFNYEFVKKLLEQMKQQQKEQQQQQQDQEQKEDDSQEQQQQEGGDQQADQQQKEQEQQAQTGEEEKEQEEQAQATPQPQEEEEQPQEGEQAAKQRASQELTKEEAEALLNAIKDEELQARELRIFRQKGKTVSPEKDW